MKSPISIECNVLVRGFTNGVEDYRHECHNIWLDNGRHWLVRLLGYDMTGYARDDSDCIDPIPATTLYENRRIMYMGVGIGGNQQSGPIPGSTPAVLGEVAYDYPGGNTQSDADPTVLGLERPVRARSFVGDTFVRWLVPVTTPAGVTGFPASFPNKWVRFSGTFSGDEINDATLPHGGGYAVVPVSELALFCYDPNANAGLHYNILEAGYAPPSFALTQALAYATIPTYNKTNASQVILDWELRVK